MASRGARAHASRIEVVQALRGIARVSAATIVSTVGELGASPVHGLGLDTTVDATQRSVRWSRDPDRHTCRGACLRRKHITDVALSITTSGRTVASPWRGGSTHRICGVLVLLRCHDERWRLRWSPHCHHPAVTPAAPRRLHRGPRAPSRGSQEPKAGPCKPWTASRYRSAPRGGRSASRSAHPGWACDPRQP